MENVQIALIGEWSVTAITWLSPYVSGWVAITATVATAIFTGTVI